LYKHEPDNCGARDCARQHGAANVNKTRQQIMREFIAHCEHIHRQPSYRALQEYLGRRPTPEITAAHRNAQVQQALDEMTPEDRVLWRTCRWMTTRCCCSWNAPPKS
jgi:hypothetical protein